jgi:hypothetical protein
MGGLNASCRTGWKPVASEAKNLDNPYCAIGWKVYICEAHVRKLSGRNEIVYSLWSDDIYPQIGQRPPV